MYFFALYSNRMRENSLHRVFVCFNKRRSHLRRCLYPLMPIHYTLQERKTLTGTKRGGVVGQSRRLGSVAALRRLQPDRNSGALVKLDA